MKTKRFLSSGMIAAVFLMLLTGLTFAQAPDATPLGTGFTYQGELMSGGTPYSGTCDFQFGLYDAATMGTLVGEITLTEVTVAKGIITTQLDFGSGKFNGENRWLGISVRCPAGTGTYTELTPRQPLTAAPYALHAIDAWSLTGNAGTVPGTNFLGTTDNQALEIKVNDLRVFRFEPNATSPNLIGGSPSNAITTGVRGATISGGGDPAYPNRVSDHYGTIGGGVNNLTGNNDATALESFATIGGGISNTAGGNYSTVSGGEGNYAGGHVSTIGGGSSNIVSGLYATVPGGFDNTASGNYSFAAGRGANAQHPGSFVWADSQGTTFYSPDDNTFNIRAENGVTVAANSTTRQGLFVDNHADGTSVGEGTAILGFSLSNSGYGLVGWNYLSGVGVGAWSFDGNLIEAYDGDFPGGALRFYVDQDGNLRYDGTASTFAEIPSPTGVGSSHVSLYGISAAEAWYEDLGSASLLNGRATIVIDPLFAQTVSLSQEYQVQVTATCGEPVLLFVSEKTETSFTVQGVSLDGKPSNCGFDYRISAKPLGLEGLRLEAIDIPEPITVEREQP